MATPTTHAPISPLRERMQHDMLMRGLGSHTQQDYVRHVRRFQLDQHENGVGHATINGAVSALQSCSR